LPVDHFRSLLSPGAKHGNLESMDNKALSLDTAAVVANTGGVLLYSAAVVVSTAIGAMSTGGVLLDGAGVRVSNGGFVQGSEAV
jgi:hypothetical protein